MGSREQVSAGILKAAIVMVIACLGAAVGFGASGQKMKDSVSETKTAIKQTNQIAIRIERESKERDEKLELLHKESMGEIRKTVAAIKEDMATAKSDTKDQIHKQHIEYLKALTTLKIQIIKGVNGHKERHDTR